MWRRRSAAPTVAGRALVVPFNAHSTESNESNLSADARAKTQLRLLVRSTELGHVPDPSEQLVVAPVPNWLRLVLYLAGSNEARSAELPPEIEVPVRVEPGSGRIVEVDVDRAARELELYRAAGVKEWKATEAPLADVRGALGAPGAAVRGAKGMLGAWRGALSGRTPEETEQTRRTADMLSHDLARNPKRMQKVRASALQAGPMMIDNVRSGSMSVADFDRWLLHQTTSGAITPDEEREWRARAGLG